MNKIVEGDELKDAEEAFVDKYIEQYETVFLDKLKDQNPVKIDTKTAIERDGIYYEINELEREKVKKQGLLKFNTLEKQRAFKKNSYDEPNDFVFKLESECALRPWEIFLEAIDFLLSRINTLIQAKLEIKDIGKDHFEMTIPNESHTIGNLLQALIYNKFIRESKDLNISFVGYFVTHPLENTVCMKLTSTLKSDRLLKFFQEEALEHAKESLETLRQKWVAAAKKAG
jgi:DNA-directed RNA polymerase subunit L